MLNPILFFVNSPNFLLCDFIIITKGKPFTPICTEKKQNKTESMQRYPTYIIKI